MVAIVQHLSMWQIHVPRKKRVRERQRIIHSLTKGNSLRNSLLGDDCHGLPAYVVHISDPSIFSSTEAPAWEY